MRRFVRRRFNTGAGVVSKIVCDRAIIANPGTLEVDHFDAVGRCHSHGITLRVAFDFLGKGRTLREASCRCTTHDMELRG